ncbi:transcription initiation factor TFIID subunit 3-like [Amphibalanus amphitrite]|uniref:transcription initiation factor TFIID subunit 3-like n=1 Tax=Amphibalanus amphitrite TaxID=1232801 RepID=UPI001C9152EA|nr:transcription initiation factor TFIID subunit 3-like [Amphibalanus amphitrite]XP_043192578.1 transcription initiation factor TFIID subunit 3-like [Amphibalanus amphitrite]
MPSLSTSEQYHRAAVRVAVAQLCQSLGWQSASGTALDVLVDVMKNYISEMAKLTGRYANQFDRTLANLDDLGLALRDFGVPVPELEDYLSSVEPLPFPHPVPQLPVPRATNLSFLKPGSQEIVTRPIHVYEHLPPMHPDTADDETTDSPSADAASSRGAATTSSPGLKRPGDSFGADAKRGRYLPEEEGRPMREISSVMMTTSGFISPAREGKLPEARLPDPLDDCGDDYRHIKTRRQRADTYRRLSERENERRNRDRWLRDDDLFDIIDVKVEEEEGSAGSSPEKLPTATQAAKLKPFKKPKTEPGTSRSAIEPPPAALPPPAAVATSPRVRPDAEKAKLKKKKPKPVDVKSSKLSIFKKKLAKKKQQGHPSEKSVSTTAGLAPTPPPAEPSPAPAPAPAAAPPAKKKVKKKLPPMLPDEPQLFSSPSKPVGVPAKSTAKAERPAVKAADKAAAKGAERAPPPKSTERPSAKAAAKAERPGARPRSPSPPLASTSSLTPPGTPGTPRAPEPRRKPSVLSASDQSPRSDDSGTPDRPRTPELPGRRGESPPPPDPAALLNNPLIPRFPFPFSGGAGPEGVPPPPFPGMPGLRPPALFRGAETAGAGAGKARAKSPDEWRDKPRPLAARALDPRRSPSDTSDMTRSPTPDISAMTPLKRLELAERAEKKKEKEHKKNKKDKKDKKKKDKKDRDKKELKSEKKEKKRKEEREKAFGKAHEGGRDESGPKLTLRLNSPDSTESRSPSPEPAPPPKLTIKPVRETPEPSTSNVGRPKKKIDKKKSEEPALLKPPKKEKEKKKSTMGKAKKALASPKAPPAAVIAETVGSFLDSEGNRIWICPECGRQDDGSPMIGCDGCDDWYHWVCVGIQVPPGDEDWFCPRCITKMQSTVKQKGKGRGKKK